MQLQAFLTGIKSHAGLAKVIISLLTVFLIAPATTYATRFDSLGTSWLAHIIADHATRGGNPFNELQSQIDQISAELDALETTVDEQLMSSLPVEVSVDCSAGETIADVLTQYENGLAPLTINITGVCLEAVLIIRDGVTLQGVSPDAGIESTSDVFGSIAVSRGAKDVAIYDLTITGGGIGVLVTKNSQVAIFRVDISGKTSAVIGFDASHIDITGSNIHDNGNGILAVRNGTLNASDSLLMNNNIGFVAATGGVINLYTFDPFGAVVDGVTVNSTSLGGVVQSGGTLLLGDAQISAPSVGVNIATMGKAQIADTVFSNGTFGVRTLKNTAVIFGAGNEFNNLTFGVSCNPDASYQVPGPPGTLPGVMNSVAVPTDAGCTDF